MVLGLIALLLPTVMPGHFIDGDYYMYRYLYTGFDMYSRPSFPFGASSDAVMKKVRMSGKVHYVLYDNYYFYDFEWKKF
jgi:hypothetical protein